MFQPAVGKTVHIVAARHAVENVRLEHGIERNPAQLNVVISQNAAIVFEILPDLEHLLILQQRFKQRQHALARDLIRRIKIIMRYRDIGGHAAQQRMKDQPCWRRCYPAVGFRIKGKERRLLQLIDRVSSVASSRIVT